MQVTDLRALLGDAAVPCPQMDIGSAFTSLAKKALNVDGFFPYNSDINFLLGAKNLPQHPYNSDPVQAVVSAQLLTP